MNTLDQRMNYFLQKYNNQAFHPYKYKIISLQSPEVKQYIKTHNIHDYYNAVEIVLKLAYIQFNPYLIYFTSNEIHLVFFDLDFYNGNINKNLTKITSFITCHLVKILNSAVTFTSKYLEFNKEYETLNYLLWRQNNYVLLLPEDVKLGYFIKKEIVYKDPNPNYPSQDLATRKKLTVFVEKLGLLNFKTLLSKLILNRYL